MQSCDLLVKVFWQHIDFFVVIVGVFPELNLREDLVRKRIRHHKARVTRAATEIHEATFGQQDDAFAVRENDVINLWLDVFLLEAVEVGNIDLVVEVADVAHDRLIFHALHLRAGYHVIVARCCDNNIHLFTDFVKADNTVAFHGCLHGADRIYFGDPNRRAKSAQRLCAALADIAVAANDRDLACDHDVGGTLDTVNERLTTAVEVVELGLGN